MAPFFNPTPWERKALEDIARGVPGVQSTLVADHAQLTRTDRGAHQQQFVTRQSGNPLTQDFSGSRSAQLGLRFEF